MPLPVETAGPTLTPRPAFCKRSVTTPVLTMHQRAGEQSEQQSMPLPFDTRWSNLQAQACTLSD